MVLQGYLVIYAISKTCMDYGELPTCTCIAWNVNHAIVRSQINISAIAYDTVTHVLLTLRLMRACFD